MLEKSKQINGNVGQKKKKNTRTIVSWIEHQE
jgi:hypothetical protein